MLTHSNARCSRGSCGMSGVQIAKAMGAANVIGVCSGANAELVTGLGCDRIVDYTKEDLAEVLEPQSVDMIYDTVTSQDDHDYRKQGWKVLKKDRTYLAINGTAMDWYVVPQAT